MQIRKDGELVGNIIDYLCRKFYKIYQKATKTNK